MTVPTRRGSLGAAAALSGYWGNGVAAAPPASLATHPDTELLAACAEFDRLEWAYIATLDPPRSRGSQP